MCIYSERLGKNARNPVEKYPKEACIVSLFARCFEYSGPSGNCTIVSRSRGSHSTKADDLMLFYCALCADNSRNGELTRQGHVHTHTQTFMNELKREEERKDIYNLIQIMAIIFFREISDSGEIQLIIGNYTCFYFSLEIWVGN